MKELLIYTFVECDLSTATSTILVIKNKTKSLVYVHLGTNKAVLLKKTQQVFSKLSNKGIIYQLKDESRLSSSAKKDIMHIRNQYLSILNNERKEGNIKYEYITGTEFQKSVWDELSKIENGNTTTYGKIAQNIGKPKAVRAVGKACGGNKLAIVLPCHRVLGSSGMATGFAFGCAMKEELLAREDVFLKK